MNIDRMLYGRKRQKTPYDELWAKFCKLSQSAPRMPMTRVAYEIGTSIRTLRRVLKRYGWTKPKKTVVQKSLDNLKIGTKGPKVYKTRPKSSK